MSRNLNTSGVEVTFSWFAPPSGCDGREPKKVETRHNPEVDRAEGEKSRRETVVYISGPYRASTLHKIEGNIRRAKEAAVKYWQAGYTVICPHANTAFMDGECADDVWLAGDIELLKRSDIVVMLPGWLQSRGATAELFEAYRHGKRVFFEGSEDAERLQAEAQ